MSRSSLSLNNPNPLPPEMPSASSKSKDLTWDPNMAQELQGRRHSSIFANPPYGESPKHDDDKFPRMAKETLTTEDRILQLEKELAQLISTSGVTRTLSEYDHEQISELDFSRYTPKNEITRINPDDWHEKKGAKFASPEASVLTVCNTSRYWAGRIASSLTGTTDQEMGKNGTSVGDGLLTDITQQRPYRLAICGFELHRALERIFGAPVSLTNNVWIWPFKPFLTYEPQIRQRLILEQKSISEMEKDRLGRDGLASSNENADHIAESSLRKPSSSSVEASQYDEGSDDDRKYAAALRLEGQLRCLTQFLDEDMNELFSVKKKISDGTLHSIAFDFLWLLFKPGDLIFTNSSQKRAYRVLHVTGGRAILDIGEQPPLNNQSFVQPARSWERHEDQAVTYSHSKNTPFLIDAFYIDFDGDGFGPVPRRFVIQEFEGEHAISTLPAFPAKLDKNLEETEEMLAKRGQRFVEMASVAHKKYSGLSAREPSVTDWQEEVNSDVVIDFAEAIKKFRKDDPSWEVGIGRGVVDQASRADRREVNEIKPCATKGCTLCKQSDIYDDSSHDLEKRVDFLDNTRLLRYRSLGKEDLSFDQVILLPPRVYGYSLLDRFWYPLNIDNVEDIKITTHDSFDDLVLPGDHKRVMQALVKHHSRGPRPTPGKSKVVSNFSADLVRGKGRGLIILLHGVPGVGKTSTAECVAAQTKRPLFPITCGDIGTTPSEVEQRLEQYFNLAHKWGCVLLLDEADVYLATREKGGDLQRNSLVSVFLRVLEYYSGILILTTNRVGEFDEAFKSRIHVSLYYPKLDGISTIKIWKMNVSRIEHSDLDIDMDSDSIIQFCEDHWVANKYKPSRRWNGRQIKNAFQTAIALATWDFNDGKDAKLLQRPKLTDKQFSVVSQTSAHFDDYLSATHQIDDEETYGVLAQREGLRSDNVPRINWGGHEGRRGSKRDSSMAISKSPRPRYGRNNRIRNRPIDQEDEEEEKYESFGSGEIGERAGMYDEDDAETRALEQELQRRRRRKFSTKSNKREIDEADEADNNGRLSQRRSKVKEKESSRSNLAPGSRSRGERARMEENSEEESDDD